MIELILTNLAEFGIIYEDWKKTKKKYRKWAIVWKNEKIWKISNDLNELIGNSHLIQN
jgi:hypothetical protein